MLCVISPAKSLDEETPLATSRHSMPRLLDRSSALIDVLRGLSPADVAALMGISDELAALNVDRYQRFTVPFTPENARPAILMFNGDVYRGMNAAQRFSEDDFTAAQSTVRILSGLYGVLRPLDLMQPYRLEMGTSLNVDGARNLVGWWGSTITELLRNDLAESPGEQVLVNLASKEYFDAVRPRELDCPVVAPRFEDESPQGKFRVVAFHAKRARGEMAAWLVQQRIRSAEELQGFSASGYRFAGAASTETVPVFRRSRQS